MLGTHAGFQVIPTLRRSFTSETLDLGDQQVYPYSFLRTRVDQWTSCLNLCLFSTYICTWRSTMLDTLHLVHQFSSFAQDLHPGANLFALCKHLARDVDDPGPRDRGLYIGNTDSLIRASEHKHGL